MKHMTKQDLVEWIEEHFTDNTYIYLNHDVRYTYDNEYRRDTHFINISATVLNDVDSVSNAGDVEYYPLDV